MAWEVQNMSENNSSAEVWYTTRFIPSAIFYGWAEKMENITHISAEKEAPGLVVDKRYTLVLIIFILHVIYFPNPIWLYALTKAIMSYGASSE